MPRPILVAAAASPRRRRRRSSSSSSSSSSSRGRRRVLGDVDLVAMSQQSEQNRQQTNQIGDLTEQNRQQAEDIRNLRAEIDKLLGSVVGRKKDNAELKEMSNIEGEVTDAATPPHSQLCPSCLLVA